MWFPIRFMKSGYPKCEPPILLPNLGCQKTFLSIDTRICLGVETKFMHSLFLKITRFCHRCLQIWSDKKR